LLDSDGGEVSSSFELSEGFAELIFVGKEDGTEDLLGVILVLG
jgi:hypothetical protein